MKFLNDTTAFLLSAWNFFSSTEKALLLTAAAVIVSFAFSDFLSAILAGKGRRNIGSLKKGSKRRSEGILFGKNGRKIVYSPTAGEGHIAVVGGSGLGKTSALLIPSLRSWNGTSLTIDISGDICKNVNSLEKLVYTPADPNTVPYNVFSSVDMLSDRDAKNEVLARLAFLLMPPSPKADDASAYFLNEGRKILIAALTAFYYQGMDFTEICVKIVSSSWRELFTEIDCTDCTEAIIYINGFQGNNEKNTAGCKQACDAAVTLFAANENVKRSVRRPKAGETEFNPHSLEDRSIFVVIDDAKLKLYAPLLHVITAQTLEYLAERQVTKDSKTVLLALDEFVSLGHLEITEALRKLRKKKVRIMILTQSISDLDMEYGRDERMSMLGNFKYIAILGANDSDTQEYFARLIGRHTVTNKSISVSSKSTTRTRSSGKDYIVEPSELGRLGKDLILIHDAGCIKLRKNFYFK